MKNEMDIAGGNVTNNVAANVADAAAENAAGPTDIDAGIDTEIDDIQKRRLLGRMAVGLAILAGLIGSLVIFDRINAPEPPATPKVAALPVAETPPVGPSVTLPAAPPAEAKPEAAAVDTAATPAPATVVDALPPLTEPEQKPLTRPATGRRVGVEPSGKTLFSDMRPEPVPPRAAATPVPSTPSAPAKAPASASPAKSAVEPERPQRAAGAPAQRPFALQMGVFNTLANAEELRARLERNGIPATIEARVHAGPFATRAEADAARRKLKELGISESMLVVTKPRATP